MYIILILATLLAVFGSYCLIRARSKSKEYLEELKQKNKKELEDSIIIEKNIYDELERKQINIKNNINAIEEQLANEIKRLNNTKKEIDVSISSQWELVEKSLEDKKKIKQDLIDKELIQYQFNSNIEKEKFIIEQENFKKEIDNKIDEKKKILEDFSKRCDSVNQAILREKELQEKDEFYSINISENDKEDIQVLSNMDIKLHNRNVIPKLIWEVFLRRPVQEMEKRVLEGRKFSGIYKITYKKTGEAYIGKSTDISNRWVNHMKTVFGVDGGCAKATIHTRMLKDGFWNYTFEVLEEVSKDKLNEREAFYIDLYGTKKQLNMKDGDKNGINRITKEDT